MTQPLGGQTPYALGHTQPELDRLTSQARFFGDLTAQVLLSAGLGPGMHVLDTGSGAGDVSFLAASLVGHDGLVIGVDRAPEATAVATERAAAAGLTNVRFITQDLADYSPDESFDALIGSRILMYFADPSALLRRLVGFVRPAGLVAFQEFDMEGAKSEPSCPLFDLSIDRIRETFTRAGADSIAGLKLSHVFEEAGLRAPQMIQGARVERGPDAEIYGQVAGVTRSLLPLMERTGVATPFDVDVETLADRLRDAALASGSTLVGPPLIGAWTIVDG